jgi:ribosomal protein S18 acetylase RimI-like enzyme
MTYTIRPARPEDHAAIAAFTEATFEWGDYVIDAFDRWVADPNGLVVVAVDPSDQAVAMSRCGLLTATEGWLQGARVRADWRRRGIAGAMATALTEWASSRGARVLRLAVEDWNQPARGQVERDGFGRRSSWVYATRSIGDASPVPSGNGGRRVAALEQLVRAHSSDAEPAYMAWSAGMLDRAARGLFAATWTWRRLTPSDLATAARGEALWNARSGWVLAARRDEALEVGWLETREEDATDLMRAIVDLAAAEGADRLLAMLPALPWLTRAVRRAGCDVEPLSVYEKAL